MKEPTNLDPLPVESPKDGTKGFSPQLSGHAKVDHAGTSGFGSEHPAPDTNPSGDPGGQEEGGRTRQSTTSAIARPPK